MVSNSGNLFQDIDSVLPNVILNVMLQQSEFGREVPCFEVEATAMEPTFDRLYSYLFGLPADAENDPNKALPSAIFILNLDKVRLLYWLCVL